MFIFICGRVPTGIAKSPRAIIIRKNMRITAPRGERVFLRGKMLRGSTKAKARKSTFSEIQGKNQAIKAKAPDAAIFAIELSFRVFSKGIFEALSENKNAKPPTTSVKDAKNAIVSIRF
jgi:hypothetical protein